MREKERVSENAFDAADEKRQRRLASLTANSSVRKFPSQSAVVVCGEIKTGCKKWRKQNGASLSISLKALETGGGCPDRRGQKIAGETPRVCVFFHPRRFDFSCISLI